MRALERYEVGALPLLHRLAERLGLRRLLERFVRSHGNDQVSVVAAPLVNTYNLARGKEPLYELPAWVASIDRRAIARPGLAVEKFNDDRFARALDRLYAADRASLMTELSIAAIKLFELDVTRIHNDSTSVKAYGRYRTPSPSGLALERGHSKDYRPDLKQLVFSLSLCADGAVPIHHKVYSGNRTDDTTHIETWTTLCAITGARDFLYVADSKLCTDRQLHHLVSHGGRAVTIVPETWSEVAEFKAKLRTARKARHEIWRRPKPNDPEQMEYFSVYAGRHRSHKRGYRIHWIHSSEKRKRDRIARFERLAKAEQALMELTGRLNTRKLKSRAAIEAAVEKILTEHEVAGLLRTTIGTSREGYRVQVGRGRPGPHTQYEERVREIYTLTWLREPEALKREARADGVFPLLCTDATLTAKEVLQAYKYQPRLEKRFAQFKSIHNAAPLLFKKVERIEANAFLFFIALMLQSLMEREVRNKMSEQGLQALALYPEERPANRPTTNKILDRFERVSTYSIVEDGEVVEGFRDELTETQRSVLRCLGMSEDDYWSPA